MPQLQSTHRAVDAQHVVDVALARAAEGGLDHLTMRDVAEAMGRSTTIIVNLFGAKSGLIKAVGEEAMRRDQAFHRAFFDTLPGLPLSRDNLLSLIQRYLRLRAHPDAQFVRIWEALLVNPGEAQRDLMGRWDAMRRAAWEERLATPELAAFAGPLISCLTIEQFYAGALLGRADYEVIAAEGLGAMVDRILGRPEGAAATTLWYRDNLILPKAPADQLDPDSMRFRLLDIAADQILAGGLAAITNRSVSVVAGTSTSTIAYHWPDMRGFVREAVWHSVFRDMPRYLAGQRPQGDPDKVDLDSWARVMAPTVSILPAEEGFYVKYARLIASVCIQARRDPSFQDLAMLLRGPEGGGTYYNSAGVWPSDMALTRLAATRFALWIKGAALTSSAVGSALTTMDLKAAAMSLVDRRY
ncbi:TetR family transcriptional regulator [Brevundimonas sp. LM2]|uniref:TetR/AcrR family transcriptional regulator n=1 Tax=Brevundimonas sp. LM2 TaxID=1938605 RepID=UPI000983FF61|nr:TetR/AcrR family transcriptional regulator [Brevundimonas sp. LM2]AQR61490.1 TetR family transcriptional regulator [Brevundimonas sp. LM2]